MENMTVKELIKERTTCPRCECKGKLIKNTLDKLEKDRLIPEGIFPHGIRKVNGLLSTAEIQEKAQKALGLSIDIPQIVEHYEYCPVCEQPYTTRLELVTVKVPVMFAPQGQQGRGIPPNMGFG